MFDILAQQLVNGIVIGMGYALVAAGLCIIFGVMGIINFAHGQFYVLGAYAVLVLTQQFGIAYIPAAIVSTALVVIFGLIVQRTVIEPISQAHHLSVLLATFALGLAIHFSLTITEGSSGQQINTPFDDILTIGPVVLREQKLLVLVAGIAVFLCLILFMRYSMAGKLMRGAAQNRHGARAVGVNVAAVERLTFGLGSGLAGLGGALIGPLTPLVPEAGNVLTLKAFAVIVLGGMGSLPGAVSAGLLLGIIETIAAGYFSNAWKDGIAYGFIIATLLLRPQGLLGRGAT